MEIVVRWPLYVCQILFGMTAIALTLFVWRKRGRGWNENLIIIPWLVLEVLFAAYLLRQVALNGWQDLPLTYVNIFISNTLLVAGPASVVAVMAVRIWSHH